MDPAVDFQMWVTLGLIAVTVVLFTLERVPLEVTAIAVLAALLVFFQIAPVSDPAGGNRLDAEALLHGFANTGLITVMALLVVGQAVVQTGALDGFAERLSAIGGQSIVRVLAISLIPVAVVSSVLNNTPVVIIFIPILSALAERLRLSASRLLIPLSYASILGGMTTLLGSSTNLLVAGVVKDLGMSPIGFFDFAIPGLVLASVGLVYLLVVAPRLLPDRTPMAGVYAGGGRQFIAQVEVLPDSDLIGETPVAGLFKALPDMTVRMIQRGEHAILPPYDDVALEVGDFIVVAATRKTLTEALAKHPLALHPSLSRDQLAESDGDDDGPGDEVKPWQEGDQALAEVMVSPASRMVGQNLAGIGFRHKTNCIVLGIQRRSRMIRQRVTEIRLEAGDELLIQGPPTDVAALRNNRDVVLLDWSRARLPRYFHAKRASAIFFGVILAAAGGVVPIVVAAVAGAALMILTGCLNIRQATRALDRRVAFTVVTSLALGLAMQETGGAAFLAKGMIGLLGGAGPGLVVSAMFLLIAAVTNVLSNNAAAVLFTPIAINLAAGLGVDPMIFVFAVIFAANCSFASPIGYQTNLLVMGPGHYRFVDFVRVGTPLTLLLWATYSLFASWYYDVPILAP